MEKNTIQKELLQKNTNHLESEAYSLYTTDFGSRKKYETLIYKVIMYSSCLFVGLTAVNGWSFFIEKMTTIEKGYIIYLAYPTAFSVQFFILFFTDNILKDYFGLIPSSNNVQTVDNQKAILAYYGFSRINYPSLFFLITLLISNITAISVGTSAVKNLKIEQEVKVLAKHDSVSNVLLAFASKEDKKHNGYYSAKIPENMTAYANVNKANAIALAAQEEKLKSEKAIKQQNNVLSWLSFGFQSLLDFISIVCKYLINRYNFFKTRHLQDLILQLDEVKRQTERQAQQDLLNAKKEHLKSYQDLTSQDLVSLKPSLDKEILQNNTYNFMVAPENENVKYRNILKKFRKNNPNKFKQVYEKFTQNLELDVRVIGAKDSYDDGEGLQPNTAHAFRHWAFLKKQGIGIFDDLIIQEPPKNNTIFEVL